MDTLINRIIPQWVAWPIHFGLPRSRSDKRVAPKVTLLPDLRQAPHAVSMTTALEMEALPPEGAEALSRLFEEVRPSLNEQKEMLALVKDIAGAEEQSIADIISRGAVADIRRDGGYSRKQKTARIRSLLKKRRYPAISRFEALFTEKLRNLDLPEKMDFQPPPDFEGREFSVRFRFQSPAEFGSLVGVLERIAQDPHFAAIMNKSDDDSDALY